MNNANIKLVVLDVDGVMTDGKLLIGSDGNEYKSFNVKDGMGISLARYHGIQFAIITGRQSKSVAIRARELNIDHVYQNISSKAEVLYELISILNISLNEVCYIGDDINDLPLINIVGLSFAPNDAVELVKDAAHHVIGKNGGQGVVREAVDLILTKQTDYKQLVLEYLNKKEKVLQ
ncbi:HAD-IIIA family hydrolase [Bacillus sp. P14.5]|uniref:KdsC family phosphatase n=1 Tax=Bacillus sp. P14.5 TaxID=1983400 RepID=UPI000DE9B071|nr:HAD-IIIA family hydrolase [Bacillus sp. P14.5]